MCNIYIHFEQLDFIYMCELKEFLIQFHSFLLFPSLILCDFIHIYDPILITSLQLYAKICSVDPFIHVLTNEFDRFNGITTFHIYEHFVCFDNKGEYGTIPQFLTLMSPFRIWMVANLPPPFAYFLYKRYPLFPVTVLDNNGRGYR